MKTYTDKPLLCVECSAAFIFTVKEQRFFARLGFQNQPKRCPGCRARRKAEDAARTARQIGEKS